MLLQYFFTFFCWYGFVFVGVFLNRQKHKRSYFFGFLGLWGFVFICIIFELGGLVERGSGVSVKINS